MNEARDEPLAPSVLVQPKPSRILADARAFYTRHAHDAPCQQTRRELGLPTQTPIVMTGHQASWWHAGILAKFFACRALADCWGAAPAWIVPDQDEQAFDTIAIPVRDENGALARESVRVTSPPRAGTPVASLPAFDHLPLSPRSAPACASIEPGLRALAGAVARHSDAPNAARQIAGALATLMEPWLPPAPTVFATNLNTTTLFADLVGRFREDADRATKTYNRAVASIAHAHVATLDRDSARRRFELPLWRVRFGQPRQPVWSDELATLAVEELAPKALLMTGALRLACADLFIHGTGGGVYDRATERWLGEWLGVELAPMLIVSATLTLPIGNGAPTEHDLHAAVWRAHHARHHPSVLGCDGAQAQRDAFVKEIARARHAGDDPGPAFRTLHDALAEYRDAERDRLAALDAQAESLRARRDAGEIADDRTWAFFLHDPAALTRLDDAIRRAVCAQTADAATVGPDAAHAR